MPGFVERSDDNMTAIVFAILLLLGARAPVKDGFALVGAITEPTDVEALMQVKASFDSASIPAASCLSSWDFSFDPCDNLFGAVFTCGLDCGADQTGTQRITALKLDSAGYEGSVSPSVGSLTALQYLQVSGNAIGGLIPSSIGNLNQLTTLDISANSFAGSIPESIGSLRSLRSLNVANNLLEGTLPGSLSNLASLVELRLQNNKFTGTLPDVSALGQLQFLDVSSNAFAGTLPAQLPASLISMSLKNNQLTGGLSKGYLNTLPMLSVLDLSANGLSGSVDASLFEHPTLQQLNLSHNAFIGVSMPPGTGALAVSQLVAVDLSYNQISGKLPPHLATIRRLSSLSLSHNSFSGRIPLKYALKAVAGLVGLQPLERLMLDGNYLTGPLPAPLMKLLPGSMEANFVENCLWSCPATLFFCQGGTQKPESICKAFQH